MCPAGIIIGGITSGSGGQSPTMLYLASSKAAVSGYTNRYTPSKFTIDGSTAMYLASGTYPFDLYVLITGQNNILYSTYNDDLKAKASCAILKLNFTSKDTYTFSIVGTTYVYTSSSSASYADVYVLWQTLAFTPEDAIKAAKQLWNF